MAAPLVPLVLGAGALWLLSQLGKGGAASGAGTSPCPTGTSPRVLASGQVLCLTPEQMQQAAGLSDQQLIGALESAGISTGTTVVGSVVSIVLGIALKGGATAATSATGTAATTVGTAAATATDAAPTVVAAGAGSTADAAASTASVFADEAVSAVASASELAGLGLVGAMIAIPYILAQTTSLLAQAIGGIARNRNRADANAPTNLDTILYNEQAATTNFVQGLISTLNSTIQSNAQKSGATPTYPNLNNQIALSGFRGFAGARRFAGFGLVSRSAVIQQQTPAAPSIMSPTLALTQPDYSKPYFEADDSYTGGRNELGATIAYCAGANSYCYYLTNVDARLPVKMISNYRGLMRWMFWTQERAYNATMEAYWSNRIWDENGISECGNLSAADCVNKFTIPPAQFDAQTAAYFQSIPSAQLLPAAYQTVTTYPELTALAAGYIQALNVAAQARPDLQIDFTRLTQGNTFNGIAQAVCQAAQIGFGGWWSAWPGDFQFTNMIVHACGLDVAGWQPPQSVFVINSQYGNANRWLIQDPTTGWFIDVVGSRDAKMPMCYKFIPQGANIGSAAAPVPNPVASYVQLSGFVRGGSRSRPRVRRMGTYGAAVPLDPPKQSWFGEMIRKGLGQ